MGEMCAIMDTISGDRWFCTFLVRFGVGLFVIICSLGIASLAKAFFAYFLGLCR
jgi:hypothetical protein